MAGPYISSTTASTTYAALAGSASPLLYGFSVQNNDASIIIYVGLTATNATETKFAVLPGSSHSFDVGFGNDLSTWYVVAASGTPAFSLAGL